MDLRFYIIQKGKQDKSLVCSLGTEQSVDLGNQYHYYFLIVSRGLIGSIC